ncbi:MAG: triphosphoribosyl-dephospho-CoA synthase [Chthoniobacterales bacterium]
MKTLYQKSSPTLKRLPAPEPNGSRPVERCLACKAEGSPPLERCLAREAEGSPPVERCLASASARPTARQVREADEGSPPPDLCALLAALARQALIAEAELTPKPGLVDRRGSGAHSDLSLAMMRRSALAIEPFIRHMAFQSLDEPPTARLRATLAATGRAAETAMLRVTNGSNTHKGAIWTLGLLAAAAAIRFNFDPIAIARTAGRIASFEDPYESAPNAPAGRTPNAERQTPNALSHGQLVAKRFGVTGARGEAISGFPHIVEIGLPMLRAGRRVSAPESIARLDALLSIMARLTDTCLLYRGGETALQAAQQGAAAIIAAGGAGSSRGQKFLFALDKRLIELGVSPGGSADLLAGTLFLDALEQGQTRIAISGNSEQNFVSLW